MLANNKSGVLNINRCVLKNAGYEEQVLMGKRCLQELSWGY
jgi:hypothetical protein